MASYRLTPRASQDLRDIWHTIAADNEKAADRLLMRIFERLELAAQHPKMGSARPELSATARVLVEGRYIIIYEPQPDGVIAVAIVHGMRDPDHWL
ncbi:type II toxin-antitoxin system RelE/ParE family toxin [Mesorhizobium sp. C277A]|uniref:type II toxin-antitoxin system RelE/ParE family toxin n=1 Tax=unclassified Mesorhizobium TaxID=325217 RepID=UPI0003CE52C2|nr:MULTISPECIES: type II toxin-antitoxin system RelE/ParE family toxin [unclassified Mesorhizobium]ESX11068.1 plasmid stabilization protein [Mesorhizobium sp. LSJC265A00]ESX96385.1 plasmid stabilization protein [Mesorhizobium sp. LNJC403B00]ESY06219.1 plasmid stabilization protein [Mesorhizobium sp. LNJC399B00]WJI67948.1 type II toxin-antitoxin system RelE/ParE family toxin [Mesorhizobium sp. C399B]